MKNNLDQPLQISALAKSARLSPAGLRMLFHRELRTSPLQYLTALRLQTAKDLLESSSLSVKEVAAKVGMNDVSHFVRKFETVHGTPPTAHRAHFHRNQQQ